MGNLIKVQNSIILGHRLFYFIFVLQKFANHCIRAKQYQSALIMKKKKATLKELKLQSFATELDSEQLENVKGGFIKVRARRYTYNVRWTSVDTRSDSSDTVMKSGN